MPVALIGCWRNDVTPYRWIAMSFAPRDVIDKYMDAREKDKGGRPRENPLTETSKVFRNLQTFPRLGQHAEHLPSDGCGRDAVPLVVERWYDFHGFGCHLGNVG